MEATAVASQWMSEFQLEFVGDDGERRTEGLSQCWSGRFEDVAPVRSFRASKGQSNFPGLYWFAAMGRHVGYESWLECDHLMLLDHDPGVVGVASQPFWLHWSDAAGPRRHAPDFFVRLGDGEGMVVDVRPDALVQARDAEAFEATQVACDQVGWRFQRVGTPAAVWMANVRWLAGYRHARCLRGAWADQLVEVFGKARPLFEGVDQVGSRLAVLPVVYHLLWRQRLIADLRSGLLGPTTMVSRPGVEEQRSSQWR